MSVEIRNPRGQPLTTADRSNAVAESLRQIARVSRFADRKKGIRSYQSHVKTDPLIPLLFLLCFVIPTLAAVAYYGFIVSDRFVVESRFALRPALGSVEKAAPDQVGTNSGASTHQMVAQDSLITTNYIASRPMVEAMEKVLPLREMFSRSDIDFFSRFSPDKPIEKLVKFWHDRVHTAIESGSGIITLTVNAFDAEESLELSKAILAESERMVNALSVRAREDAVSESVRELQRAEDRMTKIRVAVAALRNKDGVLDAQKTNESNLKVIAELRSARINLAVQLIQGQRDLSPGTRRIQDMQAQLKDLDDNITRIERQSASEDPEQRRILADSLTRFEAFDADRADAEKYFAKVLVANERARIMAERQLEFFTMIVQPVKPESSTQPRRLLMILLIAGGAAVVFTTAVVARKYMA
ncbi:capsule biosynthesis protein [Methylobacterium sp.]|jgi:capsular polysaccharide transport system permease protein|uniref:capsule biosynthesis protein n=1 Tax=Methylobacterium sp. TaxID=409 RepID=UPI002609217D|nr:capsule biosynthesis protein [Methylobacterium sp.]MDB5647694.1 capsule biosynthesis protein [Methylobacterium sp.]